MFWKFPLILLALFVAGAASAQAPAMIRDIESLAPKVLSKAQLDDLLPGSKVTRVIANGNTHIWTNDKDGTFIVSSDNRSTTGKPATGRGKWHVSEDGRFCILIQWRTDSEEWCRFVLETTDGYYAARAVQPGTEKVYKLAIAR